MGVCGMTVVLLCRHKQSYKWSGHHMRGYRWHPIKFSLVYIEGWRDWQMSDILAMRAKPSYINTSRTKNVHRTFPLVCCMMRKTVYYPQPLQKQKSSLFFWRNILRTESNKRSKDLDALLDSCSWGDIKNRQFSADLYQKLTAAD